MVAVGSLMVVASPMLASDTDDRIESSARKSYIFKSYLADDSVKAKSKNGVVTLTGTVSEASHKSLAEDTVEGLPGVQRVDNQIVVKGESPAEHSDGWLKTKVKSVLMFHRNVSATGTKVTVVDGVVTLRGEAANLAQKELTTEYARDVEGVREVRNEMTVASKTPRSGEGAGDKVDDASITAQVKSSLLWHRSTSAIKTKVQTTDGVVTISGVAKNEAEKSLVTKIVSDIHGVTKVINLMTVDIAAASGK